jgi:hypothetical protein
VLGWIKGAVGGGSAHDELPPLAVALPPEAFASEDGPKVQCPSCGRRFLESAFEKHERICEKVGGCEVRGPGFRVAT